MKFLCFATVAAAFSTAGAFTTSPSALVAPSAPALGNVFNGEGNAHRNRRSTIVMDGKANGEWQCVIACVADSLDATNESRGEATALAILN